MRPRQLPPISSPPQLSEPDMGSRQARYIVGSEEVAQRAGPVLDYEEVCAQVILALVLVIPFTTISNVTQQDFMQSNSV